MHGNDHEWQDPGHIDEWEDMLPEERKLEQGSRHSGGSSGGGVPGFVWVWIILMLLWLIGFFH